MDLRTHTRSKFIMKDKQGMSNGYLVPIYRIHDKFFAPEHEPQQVYLPAVAPHSAKGPYLHHVRTGCFTCINGNVRVIVKTSRGYQEYWSGEALDCRFIEILTGIPALIQNPGSEEAFFLNMPCPAWTSEMNDEHEEDFMDFDCNA